MDRAEHLHRALFRELNQAFQQLLLLERIAQADAAEQLWRKVRNAGELHRLTLSKGVTDLNSTVVMQTNDIAGERLFNMRAIAGHKGQRIGNHHIFPGTHLPQFHALFITARYHTHERHAVAVFGIHIRLNLEDKTTELLFAGFHDAGVRFARHRRRRPGDQAIQHVIDPKVTQRSPEEHRRQFAVQKQRLLKFV